MNGKLFYLILTIFCLQLSAQKSLEIQTVHFNNLHVYQVYESEDLIYKRKGDFLYHRSRIVNLSDSMIALENGTDLRYHEIKKLRISRRHHLLSTFKIFFFGLGFGFFPLNTINQLITNNEPVISEKAAIVSGALLGAAIVVRELNIKRVRITHRNTLHFRNINFDNLK